MSLSEAVIPENKTVHLGSNYFNVQIYLLYSDVKKNKLENIVIPKIYSKIIVLLHIEYHKLMDKYRPEQHSYKPNITLTKIKHFILNSIEKNYLVAMLNTI